MSNLAKILFVDDDPDILQLFIIQFSSKYTIESATTFEDVRTAIEAGESFDILLCDQHLPDCDGADIVKYIKNNSPDTIRIMVSAYTNFDQLVEAINEGEIYRFVRKPWKQEEMAQILSLALRTKLLEVENTKLIADLRQVTKKYELRNEELLKQRNQLSHLLSVLYDIQREYDILKKLDLVVQGITSSGSFGRAIIYLLDESLEVKAFRYAGLPEADAQRLLKSKPLTLEKRKALLQEKYKCGNSYFIPYPESDNLLNGGQLIPSGTPVTEDDTWHPHDLLLIPLHGHNQKLLGLLSVDEPPNGRRPSNQELHIIELFAHEAGLIIEQEEIHTSMEATHQIMETQNIELRGKKMIFYSLLSLNYLTRTSIDIDRIIESFKDYVIALFNADTFHLFLSERENDDFFNKISYVPLEEENNYRLSVLRETFDRNNPFLNRIMEEKRPIFINSFKEFKQLAKLFYDWRITSIFAAPLIYNERILGIMCVGFRKPLNVSLKILEDFELFTNQLAGILFQKRLIQEQDEMQRVRYLSTIQALAKAIEKKDPYTRNHCDKVRIYSLKLAEKVSLPSANTHQLEIASILHDIGKIGISMGILRKKTPLNQTEIETIKKHPEIGEEILDNLPDFEFIRSIIRHHQEWFNGGGYPDGLKGEEIPLEARILSIADAYDAMTSDRPYRKAMSQNDALSELRKHSGIQWDPELVDIFIDLIQEDQVPITQLLETSSPYSLYTSNS